MDAIKPPVTTAVKIRASSAFRNMVKSVSTPTSKLNKEKVTQAQLAKAAQVTEVTIRKSKKDLMKKLKLELS